MKDNAACFSLLPGSCSWPLSFLTGQVKKGSVSAFLESSPAFLCCASLIQLTWAEEPHLLPGVGSIFMV